MWNPFHIILNGFKDMVCWKIQLFGPPCIWALFKRTRAEWLTCLLTESAADEEAAQRCAGLSKDLDELSDVVHWVQNISSRVGRRRLDDDSVATSATPSHNVISTSPWLWFSDYLWTLFSSPYRPSCCWWWFISQVRCCPLWSHFEHTDQSPWNDDVISSTSPWHWLSDDLWLFMSSSSSRCCSCSCCCSCCCEVQKSWSMCCRELVMSSACWRSPM